MEIITLAVIIGVVYQLAVSIFKKVGAGQTQRNPSGSPRPPNETIQRELRQGMPRDTWKEHLKQILEKSAYPNGRPGPTVEPDSPMLGYLQTEEYWGTDSESKVEGIPHVERTPGMENAANRDYPIASDQSGYKRERSGPKVSLNPEAVRAGGTHQLALAEKDLVTGIVWAEVLGKPRAKRPFRGPRT